MQLATVNSTKLPVVEAGNNVWQATASNGWIFVA